MRGGPSRLNVNDGHRVQQTVRFRRRRGSCPSDDNNTGTYRVTGIYRVTGMYRVTGNRYARI